MTFASPAEPLHQTDHNPGFGNEPIDINRQDSVNYWFSSLGCGELELRVAVAPVGPVIADVGSERGKRL